MSAQQTFHIDEELVMSWAELSGDFNPIHVDAEFAATTRYGRRIAHGPILAAHVVEWVQRDLAEGRWSESGEIAFRFRDAVLFPDDVTATAEIASENGRSVATITCRSADDRVVLTADATWS